MKKITRRSFMAAAGLTVAALALTACGGSSSTASSAAASSVASSAAASSEAASAAATELTTVEAGKLTMATNAAFPPYEMTTDAGEFEGIDVDTAKAIAEKLGLELQIDDMDFDAALLSVQQGKADIVMAMPKHGRSFMTRSWTHCHRWMMTGSGENHLRWRTTAKSGW